MATHPPVNLDANASYGLLEEVREYITSLNYKLFNPSSIHQGGQRMRALIEQARHSISSFIALKPSVARLVFTSGATESNNTAICLPFLERLKFRGENTDLSGESGAADCIVSAIEHPSVLAPVSRLSHFGVRAAVLTPAPSGALSLDKLLRLIGPQTKLVSIMLANNETGQITDIAKFSSEIKQRFPHVLLHTDAVQAAGKIPIDFHALGVDMLSLSAHKMGGLSGVGALVLKKNLECVPLLVGGAQEHRWRSGTENILGISCFGIAAEVMQKHLAAFAEKMQRGRDFIRHRILSAFPDCIVHGAGLPSLPNTLSLWVPGIFADDLVVALDLENVFISSGAACSSGKPTPSHVLLARGLSEEEARQTIRISLRADWKQEEIERASAALIRCIERMRNSPAAMNE